MRRRCLKIHATAKDAYMTEVAVHLLTRKRYPARYVFPVPDQNQSIESKWELIVYMLFGTHVEYNDAIAPSLLKHTSLGKTWLLPKRYVLETPKSQLIMVMRFLKQFEWYPKVLDLNNYDLIQEELDLDTHPFFKSLMSQVETVYVEIDDYTDATFADTLEPLWLVLASEPALFTDVILSACVTNLGDLMSKMREVLFCEESRGWRYSEQVKFAGLKRIELLGNDAGTHPHEYGYPGLLACHVCEFIPFLAFQHSLETLAIEGFENIVKATDEERYGECESSYEGFEEFYNYLPHVISKQTFRSLCVAACKLSINTTKSMLSAFLSCQTCHDQSLKIIDCEIVAESNDTFSSDYPLVQPTTSPCVCGGYKTMSIYMNDPLLTRWLFEYPYLHLKRLELTYDKYYGGLDLQSLDTCPTASFEELCVRFCRLGYNLVEDEVQAFKKLIELPSLSELEFVKCYSTTDGDGLLSVMTDVFSQPFKLTCLRRLRLEELNINYTPDIGNSTLQSFFDTLFSMPKDQLSQFTLEVVCGYRQDHCQEIVNSWSAHSRGQRIRALLFSTSHSCAIHQQLLDVAVNVSTVVE